MHTHSDSRLKYAISGNHDVLERIDDRLIQRMGDRSHHAVRRAPGQFGIGVERNHEADLGKNREIADLHRKTVVLAAQELIQIEQLAALALPSHPSFFARVVDPVAMEKKERAHILSRNIVRLSSSISFEHNATSELSSGEG